MKGHNKMKIAFDLDCVLAEFELEFCKRYGWEHRELFRLQDRYPDKADEITKFIASPDTYHNLQVNELALEYFRYFERSLHYTVFIATSRPANCFSATVDWLVECGINTINFIYSKDKKIEMLKDNGIRMLIDDAPHFLDEAEENGIFTLAWRQPWNEKYYPALVAVPDGLYWYFNEHEYNQVL